MSQLQSAELLAAQARLLARREELNPLHIQQSMGFLGACPFEVSDEGHVVPVSTVRGVLLRVLNQPRLSLHSWARRCLRQVNSSGCQRVLVNRVHWEALLTYLSGVDRAVQEIQQQKHGPDEVGYLIWCDGSEWPFKAVSLVGRSEVQPWGIWVAFGQMEGDELEFWINGELRSSRGLWQPFLIAPKAIKY